MMYTNFEQFSIKKEPGIKEETMPVNDRTLPLKENSRDILMDFGMNRKKVLHLDGSNSLLTECKKHVCSDPALSDLLSHSYLVFQEFTPKFNTWVDIDSENNLRDGSVVKVLFFPKVVETDGLNPGSIKRKRDNVDIEANPKQYRISGDIGIKSNSLNRGDENGRDDVGNKRNEVMYVDLTERYDKSHSFETRGSEGELVNQAATPSPVTRKKQNFLLPKTIKADVHVTSTNVQPENLKDIESADLCPDFLHLPSYTVEQRTGVLSEQQTLNERIPHNPILNEEHSKKKNQKKKKVTPSRAQSLRIVNRKENGSKSSAANVTCARVQSLSVSNQQGNSPHSSSVNVTPVRMQPLLIEEISSPSCPGKSASEKEGSERYISWTRSFNVLAASERLRWARNVGCRRTKWTETVFSDIAVFALQGNRIKYFEDFDPTKKEYVIFWGFRTFDGPNIIAPLASIHAPKMAPVLKNVVRRIMEYYKSSDITIQYPKSFRTQFDSKAMKISVNKNFYCMWWPKCAKDLSPVYHAWKLVVEKVKNIPCSSKQKIISVVTGLWEKDVDVQLMCAEVISSLPQIVESVIQRNGCTPEVKVRYFVNSSHGVV